MCLLAGEFASVFLPREYLNVGQDLARFALPDGGWWGGSTHRANLIYLHILRWPADTITLPPIPRRILRTSVLTGGKATAAPTGSGIEVSVPAAQRDPLDTIVELELDGPATSAFGR
jgi:hypothetical protein